MLIKWLGFQNCRCEDYAISLLEQCEDLREVETFLQTRNCGTKDSNYILAILDSRMKFVAHERFQYVLLKKFGEFCWSRGFIREQLTRLSLVSPTGDNFLFQRSWWLQRKGWPRMILKHSFARSTISTEACQTLYRTTPCHLNRFDLSNPI